MAQDDMFVVMYKLLAYLYDCMKHGERPKESMYSHDGDMLDIPYPYWCDIIEELADNGLVSGFSVTHAASGETLVHVADPRVTMAGVAFMQENASMARALRFLKEAKSALPFI